MPRKHSLKCFVFFFYRAGGTVYHEATHPRGGPDVEVEENQQVLFYDASYNEPVQRGVRQTTVEPMLVRAFADELRAINPLYAAFTRMGEVLDTERQQAEVRNEAMRTVFIRELAPPEGLDLNDRRRYAAQDNRFEVRYENVAIMQYITDMSYLVSGCNPG